MWRDNDKILSSKPAGEGLGQVVSDVNAAIGTGGRSATHHDHEGRSALHQITTVITKSGAHID